jgi:CRP-like cAMP-binding protein
MTDVIYGTMSAAVTDTLDEALRRTTIFRRLPADDRQRLAAVTTTRAFEKGEHLFREGDASELLFTVASGRVKVTKMTTRGSEVILEIFGPGDPVGAVAVYEARPYPASAIAIEPTTCLVITRQAFFSLLESYPSMVRGLLTGLTHRLVELTNRLAEFSTGRIDARLARFFLKLADNIGQPAPDGTFIPLALSRQELADMIGTTIETAIRIMSRWGKDGVLRTDKDGFLIANRAALETIALS